MKDDEGYKEIPFVRELMRGRSEEEMREGEENMRALVALMWRMAGRLVDERRDLRQDGQIDL